MKQQHDQGTTATADCSQPVRLALKLNLYSAIQPPGRSTHTNQHLKELTSQARSLNRSSQVAEGLRVDSQSLDGSTAVVVVTVVVIVVVEQCPASRPGRSCRRNRDQSVHGC